MTAAEHRVTRAGDATRDRHPAIAITTSVICALAFATQYVAARLAYHPHLGPWLYRASGTTGARLRIVALGCFAAAVVVLASYRWRWSAVLLVVVAVSAIVAREAPVYSPTRIVVWYTAYREIRAYDGMFTTAAAIFAVSVVAITTAMLKLAGVPAGTRGLVRPSRATYAAGRFPAARAVRADAWGLERPSDDSMHGPSSFEPNRSTTIETQSLPSSSY